MPALEPLPQIKLRDDPNQDAIWKRWLSRLQSNVSTLGGFASGSVPFAASDGTLTSDTNFTYNSTTDVLTVTSIITGNGTSLFNNADNTTMMRIGVGTDQAFATGEGWEWSYSAALGGTLQVYDRAGAAYKPSRFNALSHNFLVSNTSIATITTGLNVNTIALLTGTTATVYNTVATTLNIGGAAT